MRKRQTRRRWTDARLLRLLVNILTILTAIRFALADVKAIIQMWQ